jgi:glyoxylase-like metal-dependent hydrolase (beta-lactamase superfamily II)
MQQWRIGDVTITKVVEVEGPMPAAFLFHRPDKVAIQAHADWLKPHFVSTPEFFIGSIHALVVESAGRRIVVDTCVGNDKRRTNPRWDRLQGPFLQDLAAAGFACDTIDLVVCTHLHVDHVGWNTMLVDGRWRPTFPCARYLFGRKEWDYWQRQTDIADGDVPGDSVRPVIDAGLADLVEPDHRLTDEVRLEHTPGHTPGHVSVRIRSRGEEAVITGDLMHHPVQCAEPGWASRFDVDPETARRTRRDFLRRCEEDHCLVLGTHFATPTAGRVVRQGDTWRFETP